LAERLPDKRVAVAMAFVVEIVLLSHTSNMLHYPYLEDDEGYYFSQGWAVFHEGRLTPYPYIYFYEHAPLGWIQMGLWQFLTGGASFGYFVASGRVLMLLFQIGSSLLVFSIARKESGRIWVGVLAAVIFALSPFGIYYHRRVLLDNVTAFWILVSLRALVGTVTLRRVWLSAAALGIAFLSKEIAMALIPAMAVLAVRQTPRDSRPFAIVGWLGIAMAVISTYPLMALLKGELFPAGTALGGHHKHVSLVCSLQWQTGRGPHDGGVLNPASQFWTQAASWASSEPLLVIGGSLAAVISIVAFRRNRTMSMLGWMILSLWLFLGTGGILVDFYLVPALPLLALSLALVAGKAVQAITSLSPGKAPRLLSGILIVDVLLALVIAYQGADLKLWRADQVDGQLQAERWVQLHVPPSSRMVIDMYMWQDLRYPAPGVPAFRYAEYYWKAAEDPAIAKGIFSGNWRKVNYVITTPQLLLDTKNSGFPLIIDALDHSVSVAQFNNGGWPVDIRRVDPQLPSNHMLRARVARATLPACMTYGT
jgi:4-amino-4-deoxy-L-arabinose transferase-like glycosyltransferase